MKKLDYLRQKDIFSPDDAKQQPITVIGAGGIGSPCVLTLAKTGFQDITVVDYDRVEPHNLPNQLYRTKDVGKPKVDALRKIVFDLTGTKIDIKKEKFTETTHCRGIIISGVDTMIDRSNIWKALCTTNNDVSLYIDARMGGQVICIHTIDPKIEEERNWYKQTLYTDENAFKEPCTARAIMYATMVCAGLITTQVAKFSSGEQPKKMLTMCLKTMTFLIE